MNGNKAMKRACLMASVICRWCLEQLPDSRADFILAQPLKYFWMRAASL